MSLLSNIKSFPSLYLGEPSMLKLKRKESVPCVNESSRKSVSSLLRDITSLLNNIHPDSKEQELAIQKSIQSLKRIPYLRSADKNNGTDRAFDACNDSMDTLFKAGIRGDVLKLIDDLIELVQA